MIEEPGTMKELHEIRRQLYEEEKNLSTEELIAKIHKEAEDVKKKYGLKFQDLTGVKS